MKILEKYYEGNYFEKIKAITSEAKTLQIATSPRLYANRQLVWSYEIAAEVNGKLFLVEAESGLTELCVCKECRKFNELAEVYSIYKALDSRIIRNSSLENHLWFYSEKFKSDYDDYIFSYYVEIYRCGFLGLLGDKLSELINGKLNLRFVEVDKNIPF